MGLLVLAGCPQPAGQTGAAGQTGSAKPTAAAKGEITVWADPVLVNALTGLQAAYKKSGGSGYQLVPKESGALVEWAKSPDAAATAPDVVLFVGGAAYVALQTNKRIDQESARTFAGDRLVVLKPLNSGFAADDVFGLSMLMNKHLAVADPATTALGAFSQQALVGDGAGKRVAGKTETYPDSLTLAGLPGMDPSTLAFSYMSQAGSAQGVAPMLLVNESLHEPIQYRAAATAGKGADPAAQNFLRWLAEDEQTQAALGGYGLLSRVMALKLTAPPAPPPAAAPGETAAPPAPTPGK